MLVAKMKALQLEGVIPTSQWVRRTFTFGGELHHIDDC